MRGRLYSYWIFSIACFVVWAVILAIYAAHVLRSNAPFGDIFGGWLIGWMSCTIARYVYPPPRRWRTSRER